MDDPRTELVTTLKRKATELIDAAIAVHIALDKPQAAREFVQRILSHVEQLSTHPDSGSTPVELPGSRYRQIVKAPCRVLYRHDGKTLHIVYVIRGERRLTEASRNKRDAATGQSPTTGNKQRIHRTPKVLKPLIHAQSKAGGNVDRAF